MGDYDNTITVDVPPARLFDYLADVRHLPDYMPRLTSAEPKGGDKVAVTAHLEDKDTPGPGEQDVGGEAWVHVLEPGKTLEWGAAGPHDYHGKLHVSPGDSDGSSTLAVELHTERAEGGRVDEGLRETLQGIKTAVERAES
jgi:uncharacterized protein YndB with AHSA1/START domain